MIPLSNYKVLFDRYLINGKLLLIW